MICRVLCKLLERFTEEWPPELDACESCGLQEFDRTPEVRAAREMRECATDERRTERGAGQ